MGGGLAEKGEGSQCSVAKIRTVILWGNAPSPCRQPFFSLVSASFFSVVIFANPAKYDQIVNVNERGSPQDCERPRLR